MCPLPKKLLLLFTDAAPASRVGGLVCAPCPSDTVSPKTHNASAPKTHASRLPVESASYQLTLKAHCVITRPLKCTPLPPVYAYALWAVMSYYWDVWKAHTLRSRLPFVPDAISDGCVCGPVERGRPGHPRLFQPRSVARIHGVGALHVPVVPVGVGVTPVLDFDRGAGLSPEMLRRLQSRLSFPGNRERQGQALLRAWWWFHHSAKHTQQKKIQDQYPRNLLIR